MKLLRAKDQELKEFSIDSRASRDTEAGDGNEKSSLSLSLTRTHTHTTIHTQNRASLSLTLSLFVSWPSLFALSLSLSLPLARTLAIARARPPLSHSRPRHTNAQQLSGSDHTRHASPQAPARGRNHPGQPGLILIKSLSRQQHLRRSTLTAGPFYICFLPKE